MNCKADWPCSKKAQYPVCPVCGEICTFFYTRCGNTSCEVVGCNTCITVKDAWSSESGWIPNGD